MKKALLDGLQRFVDAMMGAIPQKPPQTSSLQHVRLVAHRGVHGSDCIENTVAAVQKTLDAKIWGVEFDVRWTQDNVAVLHHDAHCGRLFQRPDLVLSNLSWKELHELVPDIPRLKDVCEMFGKHVHFMIELKEPVHKLNSRLDHLRECLSTLIPCEDYYIMSLDPALLPTENFPRQCLLAIAETNTTEISQWALKERLGGLTGHYLLITNALLQRHLDNRQKVGTGFVSSKNVLFREIKRGVSWFFSNNAHELQAHLDAFTNKE